MNQLNRLNIAERRSRATRWLNAGLFSGLMLTSLAVGGPVQAASPAVSTPAHDEKIEWRSGLNATLAEARQQNKLVLLRFTAEWCAPCRVMDAQVWPDSSVQSVLADKYLIVKSDIDVEANQVLARKYRVQAVPTLIVLNGDGKEIKRDSFMSSPELIKFLDAAAKTIDESEPPARNSS